MEISVIFPLVLFTNVNFLKWQNLNLSSFLPLLPLWILDRYCLLSKGMFMTPRFLLKIPLCLSFNLPVFHDPSLRWGYRICFGSLLFTSLFKWPTHLRLFWASTSYKLGYLDFSSRNLFGISCHHLTFSILHKWHIILNDIQNRYSKTSHLYDY